MRTSLTPVGAVLIRRRLYTLLLLGGLCGLLLAVLDDARTLPVARAIPAAAPPANPGMVQVTKTPGMDGFGAVSPDGRRIAFMRDGRIMLMRASGGAEPVPLTENAAVWDAVPVWRPDGREIAFVRTSMHGGTARIMLVRADGRSGAAAAPGGGTDVTPPAQPRVLAEVPEPVGHIAWDPSGRSLYYTTARELWRLIPGSGATERVVSLPTDWEMTSGGLTVSPDGRSAIFGAGPRVGRRVDYDLWQVPLRGQKVRPARLTTDGGIMPGYSPSGRLIAYRNPRAGTGIYLMEVQSRRVKQVVPDEPGAMYFHPVFTPDGQRLLLSRLMLRDRAPGAGRGRFTSHLYLHRLAPTGGDRR